MRKQLNDARKSTVNRGQLEKGCTNQHQKVFSSPESPVAPSLETQTCVPRPGNAGEADALPRCVLKPRDAALLRPDPSPLLSGALCVCFPVSLLCHFQTKRQGDPLQLLFSKR